MKNNKIVFITISTIIAIVMAISLCSLVIIGNSANVVAIGYNASINGLSTTNVIDPRYDSKLNGDGWTLNGNTRTFTEAQWNGRIETELHLGGISYIYINVDPRDVAWNDDIIIEYRSYYKDVNGNKVNQKVQNFYAHITFHTKKDAYISQTCGKDMDSQAGFTRYSGKGSVNWIKVSIKITTLGGVVREANFNFA